MFFALAIFGALELFHWAVTGELASISKGAASRQPLSWQDEPGYVVFTAIIRLLEFLAGIWGMIDELRSSDPR